MADQPQDSGTPVGSQSELIAQLQNIARQLSGGVQSMVNAAPAATTTSSPKFTAVSLSTATSVVIASSTTRHGLLFHNPGTANVFIYQTGMTSSPTSTVLAGAVAIVPFGTFTLPSPSFPNLNSGFSGFTQTGSSQALTLVEFF